MNVTAAAAAIPILLGILILVRRGPAVIGTLLVLHGLSVALVFTLDVLVAASPQPGLLRQLSQGSWILLYVWLVLIVYLMPDGVPSSRWWRRWVGLGLAGSLLFLAGAAGMPADENTAGPGQPLAGLAVAASLIGLVVSVAFIFGAVPALIQRMRRANEEQCVQLLWLAWGALSLPVGLILFWINIWLLGNEEWVVQAVLLLVIAGLPVTMTIAIVASGLFDIKVVLSATLRYTILTAGVLAVYSFALFAADQAFNNRTFGGALGVVVIALGIHPAASWLRRRVDRLVYGYRSTPIEALRLLGTRADTEGDLAPSLAATLSEALRVERVRLELCGAGSSTPAGDAGTMSAPGQELDEESFPLTHRGRMLGNVVIGLSAGRSFTAADRTLVADLSRYCAAALQAEQLLAEVSRSRARTIAAREEERRRLRRDLHDGLGPALSAVVLQLDRMAARGHEPLGPMVAETKSQVRDVIAEVRALVEGLRPPALDEVGLVNALRQRAGALSLDLRFTVKETGTVQPLPAAVEVAAYRIAEEAMNNAARHSGASACNVQIRHGDPLELIVRDDGRGFPESLDSGVGLASLRERAEEIGGSFHAEAAPGGGALIRVLLPTRPSGAELPLLSVSK